jgi:tripartite ATP-independent transporter DctP family solute receptor
MKRVLIGITAVFLLMALAAPALAADKVVIKMAGMKPEGEPETIGMRNFAKYMKDFSKGKFDVQVFPNSQLGKEDAYIASTRKGIIQMCATGTQTSALHPAMALIETPMLFDNLEHARRAMEGDTGKLIVKGFTEKSGMRLLNYFPLGYRVFYTKKPIQSMDDLKGLRLRVPNIPLYINFAKECGISGQPMPFAEVPSALDQGVIDGGDSPLQDVRALKMYEIAPYITRTRHILVIHSLYINEAFYQGLSKQEQGWIDEAAKHSADDVWKLVTKEEKEIPEQIAKAGAKIADLSPEFRKQVVAAGQRSWKLFYDTVPNAKEILESANKYR